MHLAAVQFTSLLETAVVLTRTQKIEWVAGVVGLWAVWSLILDGRSRGRNT
jgi:hypothetical protein